MKKLLTALILLIFSFSVSAQKNSSAKKSASTKKIIAQLEEDIPDLMKKSDVPGISAALIRNGKLVWLKSFGVKNAQTKELVTEETVFTPLKMNASSYVWKTSYTKLKADRHDSLGKLGEGGEAMEATAAASLLTNAEDYARFLSKMQKISRNQPMFGTV